MVAVVAVAGMASPAIVGRAPIETLPFGGTTTMGIHAWTAMQDRIRNKKAFLILHSFYLYIKETTEYTESLVFNHKTVHKIHKKLKNASPPFIVVSD
jgi:hypothetical protein